PKGFFVRNIFLNFDYANSPFTLNFKAREIRELDQSYSAEAGRVGKFRTQFLWDQIPYYYSDGRSFHVANSADCLAAVKPLSPTSTAEGCLAVSPLLRASLEAAPNAGATTSQVGTQLPALLSQQIPTEPVLDLRVRSDQLL